MPGWREPYQIARPDLNYVPNNQMVENIPRSAPTSMATRGPWTDGAHVKMATDKLLDFIATHRYALFPETGPPG